MNAAPVFTELPKDSEVLQGSSADLQCKALGKPRPEVHWYKGRKLLKTKKDELSIESISNEDDLEIMSCMSLSEVVTEDETLQYRIEAINKIGKVEHEVTLTGEILHWNFYAIFGAFY